MSDCELIQEYRGPLLENVHRGWVCVVDQEGTVTWAAGDPHQVAYMRSSAKPIQALAFFALDLEEKYQLTGPEKTILAGSHMGGPYHIEALASIARKMDIREEDLVLLPCLPTHPIFREKALQQGVQPRKFYHNCAGKHLATIAMARHLGQDISTYYEIGTPVQQYLLDFVSQITTCPAQEIVLGVDGCGVPVYGMPLSKMATGYARLAFGQDLPPALRAKADMLVQAMHQWPQYITKEDFICTCLNQDDNLLAKGGAQGVYCFAIQDTRQAVAFKVEDGSEEEWQLVVWSILKQLGYEHSVGAEHMLRLRPMEIINATGRVVGEYRPVFQLQKP